MEGPDESNLFYLYTFLSLSCYYCRLQCSCSLSLSLSTYLSIVSFVLVLSLSLCIFLSSITLCFFPLLFESWSIFLGPQLHKKKKFSSSLAAAFTELLVYNPLLNGERVDLHTCKVNQINSKQMGSCYFSHVPKWIPPYQCDQIG